MRVVLQFSSLTEEQMRNVLVAHRHEVMEHDQPKSVTTSECRQNNQGGAFVRVAGTAYEVTTVGLWPQSAAIVLAAVDATHDELMHIIHPERKNA